MDLDYVRNRIKQELDGGERPGSAAAPAGRDERQATGPAVWSIDGRGTLTIAPPPGCTTGTLKTTDEEAPWHSRRSEIRRVKVEPGVRAEWSLTGLFQDCKNLRRADLRPLDVSEATNFESLFGKCPELETVELTGWDMSKAESLWGFFDGCESLQTVHLQDWNLASISSLDYMFDGCERLTMLDLSSWKVAGTLVETKGMFNACEGLLTLNLSGWDVSNVTDMESMFFCCRNLRQLRVDGWDISSLEERDLMFFGCESLSKPAIFMRDNIIDEILDTWSFDDWS